MLTSHAILLNLLQLSKQQVTLSYPQNALISFSISVESSRLWDAPYSEYQEYLFSRVRKYRESFLPPLSYLKIAKVFRAEGLLTHSGKEFKATHAFSIYKKGKVREERLNRPDIVEVSPISISPLPVSFYRDLNKSKNT